MEPVIMFKIFVLLLLLGLTNAQDTCKTCTATYVGDAKADEAAKCNALTTYITCLDGTIDSAEDCPLSEPNAKVIADFEKSTCTTKPLTKACNCQKLFWAAKGDCGFSLRQTKVVFATSTSSVMWAVSALETCIDTDTSKGCDGTTDAADILKKAKERLSCHTDTSGVTNAKDTCKTCRSTYEGDQKADEAAKCNALTTYITCLDGTIKTAEECPLSDPNAKVFADFEESTCTTKPLTKACNCQKLFWAAKGDCGAVSGLEKCIDTDTSKGCDGTSDAADILKKAKERLSCPTDTETSGNESTTKASSKDGAQATGASGLIITILLSILGMFNM